MKNIIFIILMLIIASSCAEIEEFQAETFVKYFGSGYESAGNDVLVLSDGGYLMTGYDNDGNTNQILIVHIDKYGNSIWNHTFGSDLSNESGKLVRQGVSGYYIAGQTTQTGSSISHAFVMKITENGDSTWFRTIGNLSFNTKLNDMYVGDDGIFVGGSVEIDQGVRKLFRAKLSLEGDSLWANDFQGINNDIYRRIFKSENGLLYVGHDANNKLIMSNISLNKGTSSSLYTSVSDINVADAILVDNSLTILSNLNNGFSVIKLDSDNAVVWNSESLNNIVGTGLVSLGDDTFLGFGISGEGANGNDVNLETHFIRIDPDGSLDYGTSTFRNIPGGILGAKKTMDGGVIITGYTRATFGKKAQLLKTGSDLFLLKP